jgi:hypothetical protein
VAAALVVAEFFVKRAAETLHKAADQLTLDQIGLIDRTIS